MVKSALLLSNPIFKPTFYFFTMSNTYISTDKQSTLISKLRQKFGDKANIQPSNIRLEKVLANSDVSTVFELGKRANMRPLETQLQDNDIFICTHMAIGLYKEDNALTGNFQRGGNASIYYYPDTIVFNTAATAVNVSEAAALEAIYNGNFGIKADTYEVVYACDTQRFRKVPRTQPATGGQASYTGEQYEAFALPVMFEGKKMNSIDFKCAKSADTVQAGGAANTTNVLVFILQGFLVRNASEAISAQELRAAGIIA